MEKPKIKIESDGMITKVYIDGKKVERCTSINFCADVEDGIHIQWSGTKQKEDENGHLIIENDEIVEEKFHYDNQETEGIGGG